MRSCWVDEGGSGAWVTLRVASAIASRVGALRYALAQRVIDEIICVACECAHDQVAGAPNEAPPAAPRVGFLLSTAHVEITL